MPLEIRRNSMNGITLGEKKLNIDELIGKQRELHLEFDNKVKKEESILLTISKRDIKRFYLNNREINIDNINEFLNNEIVLIENLGTYKSYIIPNYNLIITIDFNTNSFDEVLIYHESLKNVYEKNLPTQAQSQKISKDIFASHSVKITPYFSVNNYLFGSGIENFKIFDIRIQNEDISCKKDFIEVDGITLRFDNLKLTQIQSQIKLKNNVDFFYKDIIVNSEEGISYLKAHHDFYLRSDNRTVFKKLGICVSEVHQEIYIFSRLLLPFWLNDKRPITSW